MQKSAEIAVIPHVVNTLGLWNSGFVVSLRHAFGTFPEDAYKAWHAAGDWTDELGKRFLEAYLITLDKKFKLGNTQFVAIEQKPKVVIASMVAQEGIGFKDGPPIRYEALEACMKTIGTFVGTMPRMVEIHAPKFGSLRSGGNFQVIEEMIQDLWVASGITVVIYDFDAKIKISGGQQCER